MRQILLMDGGVEDEGLGGGLRWYMMTSTQTICSSVPDRFHGAEGHLG